MSCISREDTCREAVAADVAARLVSVATQYKQANDAKGSSFDTVMAQFPPKLLKEAHKTGVANKDLGNGAVLTTKEAVGLDGSSIKYGFVTDSDGKRYTVSDGLVKEVTGAAGSEWQEAFDAAVRSKIAENVIESEAPTAVRAKPVLPEGVQELARGWEGRSKVYRFNVNDVEVNMLIRSYSVEGEVDFEVGGSYRVEVGRLSPRDSAKVAIKLASIIKYDASTRDDGYKYYTKATIVDGHGAKRALAYQRLGFSRPIDGKAGEDQYGVVLDGKLIPDDAKVAKKDTLSAIAIEKRMAKLVSDRKSTKLKLAL
jgi:hypothetical protein